MFILTVIINHLLIYIMIVMFLSCITQKGVPIFALTTFYKVIVILLKRTTEQKTDSKFADARTNQRRLDTLK
jgi:capsular polysaccharide biosynthesis protein